MVNPSIQREGQFFDSSSLYPSLTQLPFIWAQNKEGWMGNIQKGVFLKIWEMSRLKASSLHCFSEYTPQTERSVPLIPCCRSCNSAGRAGEASSNVQQVGNWCPGRAAKGAYQWEPFLSDPRQAEGSWYLSSRRALDQWVLCMNQQEVPWDERATWRNFMGAVSLINWLVAWSLRLWHTTHSLG